MGSQEIGVSECREHAIPERPSPGDGIEPCDLEQTVPRRSQARPCCDYYGSLADRAGGSDHWEDANYHQPGQYPEEFQPSGPGIPGPCHAEQCIADQSECR